MADEDQAAEETTSDEADSTSGQAGEGFRPRAPNLSPLAQHEMHPNDRVAAHRLVATSMIVVFLVTAISQNWWKHLRDWVSEKTHGPAQAAKPGG